MVRSPKAWRAQTVWACGRVLCATLDPRAGCHAYACVSMSFTRYPQRACLRKAVSMAPDTGTKLGILARPILAEMALV